ncbi:MAG: hypothetical protein L2C94_001520 [Aigarchaeota archaeon]|nr:hypothetical protein [Candidatus Wolframiiraptor gerlachensis]
MAAGGPHTLASEAGDGIAYMHKRRSFTCRYCGESFGSMASLAAHISWRHSQKRQKSREERIIELLEELLAEVKALRQDLKSLKLVEYTRRTEEKVREIRQERPPDKKLPSFLIGNPWLDILSRRAESD